MVQQKPQQQELHGKSARQGCIRSIPNSQPTNQLTDLSPPPRGNNLPCSNRKITDGHPTTIFPTQPNREEANPNRLERKLLPTCFNLKLSFGFGFARSVSYSSPTTGWDGAGGEFVSLSTPVYHLATAGGKTEGKNRWKNISTLAQLPARRVTFVNYALTTAGAQRVWFRMELHSLPKLPNWIQINFRFLSFRFPCGGGREWNFNGRAVRKSCLKRILLKISLAKQWLPLAASR